MYLLNYDSDYPRIALPESECEFWFPKGAIHSQRPARGKASGPTRFRVGPDAFPLAGQWLAVPLARPKSKILAQDETMCSDGIDGAAMRASVRLQWGGDGRSVMRLRQGVLGAGSVLGFGRQEVQPAQGDVWQKREPAQQENAAVLRSQ